VIDEYARRDPRVKMLDNQKRILASAWNTASARLAARSSWRSTRTRCFQPRTYPTCVALMREIP
jgi:hypothetical protein